MQPSRMSNLFDRVSPGDHLCGLTSSVDEHQHLLSSIIQGEIQIGNRVIYITDRTIDPNFESSLADDPISRSAIAANQLSLVPGVTPGSDSAGFQPALDPNSLLSLLEKEFDHSDVWPGTRIIQDLGCLFQQWASPDAVMEYESRLNKWMQAKNCGVVCLFERQKMDAEKNSDGFVYPSEGDSGGSNP